MRKLTLIAATVSVALLAGCQQATQQSTPAPAVQAQPVQSEIDKANAFFEDTFNRDVMSSPVYQTYMGIKKDYDKWDDNSEEKALKDLAQTKADLVTLNSIDRAQLDAATQVSYDLKKQDLEASIADFKWRYHNYPVNQMFGTHSMVPAFLINQHQISNVKEANDYIARLNGVPGVFDQLITGLEIRADKNIIAPKFVFPHVIDSSKNIIKGAPFEQGEDSTLLADFKRKVNALEIDQAEKDALISKATDALKTAVKPAYSKLINYIAQLEKRADDRDGAWKFPDGEAFYNNALKRTTTTDLTAKEIHAIGLAEVSRIHDEMRAIKDKVGFEGDLNAFMQFMKTDKQFYLANTEAGKAQYLSEAKGLIDNMKTRLDELFIVKPKADMIVKRVEAFREKAAGKAFYQQPAPDGSRPGIYYANLYDMEAMPTYQMEALAYHEGIPGHHMQIAISQELEGVPKFRKFGGYTAYIEGWGLYSELLPKEMGLYEDPYSDFGRLAMELWRACRLVVDTGIHAMKWTRQEGIDYYVNNTPNATSDGVKMVERHIVMPSQATAYKVGMLKILELREAAKKQLGDKFDIRQFHDVVLKNGPVPLNVLENFVDEWVASKQA
ncbi:lipoprotein [Pseudoalteromonas sp. BSi20311]|uniref:DUF885 domain-containing protein n=1 Tax=unclassified Pseudoalteromonas TaxID=194690 RepID=UPI00023181A8|nr:MULTISPECIES: DUF885 domain-containing protein [unclassified Pseudoalteromonas]MCK8127975.1 DUF885 domain-containing protein [Pseudoalteromonas sp. 2CM39R]PWS55377.1 DUF885 domain-containing protein [Pseudoalteromonas sp. meg-B1]TMP56108.1 DUF885 domain-containing protein [Pseudoalteromonas sp. S1610]TMP76626.1 DUF885 domain-containing protein [Pseudoalteromonas sp. S1608]GAA64716.1 lipoprotein [Pseudoalteromonas sp. BSi20311]|tara:strand:- start:48 stop:1880 length:1833 start_codon:yes stop_codon:yes gene_type:complete